MFGRKEFKRLVASIGLNGWTPDELRHSAASLMSDAGMPIEQVADQLGHKDLLMLQKHYRHRIRPWSLAAPCSKPCSAAGAESTSGRSPRRPRERGLP